MFLTDWIQGQKDCRDGVPHKDGNGAHYDLGYSEEYAKQQCQDAELCRSA